VGVTIRGDLNCSGSQFASDRKADDHIAFESDSLKIDCSTILSEQFECKGEVRLLGSE
jgi:hypothetical protein